MSKWIHFLQNTTGGYAQYRYDKEHKIVPPNETHITFLQAV